MRPRLADFATTTERRSSEDTAAQWLQQAQHRGTAFTGEAGRGSLQRALWWRGGATPLAGYAAGGYAFVSGAGGCEVEDAIRQDVVEPGGGRVVPRMVHCPDCGIDPRRAELRGA